MTADELRALGWKPAFHQQLLPDELQSLKLARVGAHLGSQMLCLSAANEFMLPTVLLRACGELAVGDWLLLEPDTNRGVRRLERVSLLTRKAAGGSGCAQLIAANVDTLFIVTSCNHDFNPSRLERYLSLAAESAIDPVVVLTKADLCDDPLQLQQQASALKSGLVVETLDARDDIQSKILEDWCGVGQTVALVGASGVGKSTLAINRLRCYRPQLSRNDTGVGSDCD